MGEVRLANYQIIVYKNTVITQVMHYIEIFINCYRF